MGIDGDVKAAAAAKRMETRALLIVMFSRKLLAIGCYRAKVGAEVSALLADFTKP